MRQVLTKGQTMGMFQLGGSGMTRYLVELKPTKITDIMAMVALFRPGPMESIPEFIDRRIDLLRKDGTCIRIVARDPF